MIGKTIERTQFGQGSQFFFCKRHPALEIVERSELSATGRTRRGESLPLALDLLGMFPSQPVHNTKSKPESVVIQNGAAEIGFRDANRLDLHPMPLCVFDECRRRIKTHRLIVEQARVKF